MEAIRERARLRVLQLEHEYEQRLRAVERARLISIGARFPDRSETARYIFAQLLTTEDCLVCGSHVPEIAATYLAKVFHKQCVVCGSDLSELETPLVNGLEEFDGVIDKSVNELRQIDLELGEARLALSEVETSYQSHIERKSMLSAAMQERSLYIELLLRQLPPEEAEMSNLRSYVAMLRGNVEGLRSELISMRGDFQQFVETVNHDIVRYSAEIKQAFGGYAKDFLLEQCQLSWAPKKAPVGQEGILIDFPAFELDMTGTNFMSPVRRSGPEQVSESQREFIDISFRMALMYVSSMGSSSSLVMDAPESSLDAVFTSRAADVLSRFAKSAPNNRLVITSNLVEGKLIPSLVNEGIDSSERDTRVVDLLTIAAPTAAVRELRSAYERVRNDLLKGKSAKGDS